MDIDTNTFHTTIMLVSFIGILIWITWAVFNRKRWLYSIAPLTYFAHILLLYTLWELNLLNNHIFDIWSDAVRLHGIFLFIIGGIILINWEKRKWTQQH